jgi:outer membrane protein assembly factor BamB
MKTLGLLFSCIVMSSFHARAADDFWPGWLGPERNGRVKGFQSPRDWPATLNKKWSVEVGSGYGSPVVVDGKAFVHARKGEDEVVHCIDLVTGKVHWSKGSPAPFKMGGGSERHGKGPKASPVYSDGRLLTMSISGIMTAWDAVTGKVIWRKAPGKGFGKTHAYWGASNSPVVVGKKVINLFGNEEKGALMALDVATGEIVWSMGKDGTCYSSPFMAEIGGVRQIVAWNHRALVGVEIESGRLLWEFPFPHKTHNQNMPTPVFHGGKILLGAENRGFHAITPRLKDGRWSVAKSWSQKEVALDMASAIVTDGLVYGLSHYGLGRIFCLDPKNGEILWQGSPRTGPYATFLSFPGHVLVLSDRGQLTILRASDKGFHALQTYQLSDNPTWAPPVLLKNGILVKDANTLTLWTFQ